MVKSAIHIHSTYSDGEFTLAELRQTYSTVGCRAVFMTDHAEFFTTEKLSAYVAECDALSDEQFRIIPGLEFQSENRMHILGLGVTRLTDETSPSAVIRHIRQNAGISVIAHPMDSMFEWIESFDELPDGIETWNSKYDGQYAPRPATFQLLHRLQARKPQVKAFYGQDLHWKKQARSLLTLLQTSPADNLRYLETLQNGDYSALKDRLELPADGLLSEKLLEHFRVVNHRSVQRKRLSKRAKQWLDRVGISIPAPLKSQLRRIF